ncbi:MAG: hypothetical protein HRT35_00860 [Algicola sp.]|nr:hypothetical protein [Algicola sp.]
MKKFTVVAGKNDGNERDIKYIENFETLDDALLAYDKYIGLPWAYIKYKGRVLEVWHKSAEF